jgi:hypothetical protein
MSKLHTLHEQDYVNIFNSKRITTGAEKTADRYRNAAAERSGVQAALGWVYDPGLR